MPAPGPLAREATMRTVLRRGSEGPDVLRWQEFLIGKELLASHADGRFGPDTEAATRAFQRAHGLLDDGVVGPATLAVALQQHFDAGLTDPLGGQNGLDWPPRPDFPPLVSNAERMQLFGAFDFRRVPGERDAIEILGGWTQANIVAVPLPAHPALPRTAKFHRKIAAQVEALFRAWNDAGLLHHIRTWEGSFVPRYVRGSATTLSNHAWGTAFDVNYRWNPLGAVPALRGQEGSVRELVPLAHQHGFYWGGHFTRRDGMHFEAAKIL
jgi:peptidoglycan hydrolase-like protein with peptidoglycan-binding domain